MNKQSTIELVGSSFHVIENNLVERQGCIVGNPEPGWYMVQFYDWIMGEANIIKLYRIEEMKEWVLYESDEDMKYSYEYGYASKYVPRRKE